MARTLSRGSSAQQQERRTQRHVSHPRHHHHQMVRKVLTRRQTTVAAMQLHTSVSPQDAHPRTGRRVAVSPQLVTVVFAVCVPAPPLPHLAPPPAACCRGPTPRWCPGSPRPRAAAVEAGAGGRAQWGCERRRSEEGLGPALRILRAWVHCVRAQGALSPGCHAAMPPATCTDGDANAERPAGSACINYISHICTLRLQPASAPRARPHMHAPASTPSRPRGS